MSRVKLYFKSSRYLQTGIGAALLMAIATLAVILSDSKDIRYYIVIFCITIPFWLIEWVRKYKYFGDIIFKREKRNKGEVLVYIPRKQGNVTYMEITVVNEENGLGEKFRYYNYNRDKKINLYSNLESIEFIYLDKSKIILSVIDYKLKENKKKTKKLKEVKPIETCNKKVIRKIYRDFEKEIDWLNEMSEKGLVLCEYTWGRYVFEETLPKQYKFTIEPLRIETSAPGSIHYIESLKENDIEVIGESRIYLYLRKKATHGSFGKKIEILSRIDHYRRDYSIKKKLLIFFWIIIIANFIVIVIFQNKSNLIIESIAIPIGILCTLSALKVKKRINKLLEK